MYSARLSKPSPFDGFQQGLGLVRFAESAKTPYPHSIWGLCVDEIVSLSLHIEFLSDVQGISTEPVSA